MITVAMILELREEIKELEREKRKIQHVLEKKITKLKNLEYLTINQLDLFDNIK